jgi:hypothetical protein
VDTAAERFPPPLLAKERRASKRDETLLVQGAGLFGLLREKLGNI